MEKTKKNDNKIETVIDAKVKKAVVALDKFMSLDQEKVDYIVKKASVAGLHMHGELAISAIEETKRGVFEDKAIKNLFACEHVTNSMANMKTVGVISHDELNGITEIAEPVGVVAGVTPVTNPTSTTIFKALIALKTRNPIIFGFHPSAQRCSAEAAKVILDAAVEAGAPADCIQWIEEPSLEATGFLMNHPDVATILATGGNAMVKAAYSCGKPALGVGAGNVPAYVEATANVVRAINDIVVSKAFDNGMICASEQAAIVDKKIYDQAVQEFKKLHAYVVNAKEKALLEKFIFGVEANSTNCSGAKLNAAVVGQTPEWIAEKAGFTVPEGTSIIIAEVPKVGVEEPLTREKLSPVLALLKSKDKAEGFKFAQDMLEMGGLGHSAVIHTEDKEIAKQYGEHVQAIRVIWNAPSSQGGIGDIYNAFMPSLTLGCGSYGHNSVSNNVTALNLINVKRVGRRNNNMQWFKVPPRIYFEPNAIRYLLDMNDIKNVTIVTDKVMTKLGMVQKIIDVLERRENPVGIRVIDYVEPEPSVETVTKGAQEMDAFEPDTIIALGGGSAMDASKIMWLLYEYPETNFTDLREKFIDIRKRAFKFPRLGTRAQLVCIPTTSGTGSEVTPFSVITDHSTGFKYPLADYSLTPSVAIVDPVLAQGQPASLAANSGLDALTHATEAYISVYSNDFTDGLCLQAIKLIFENLADSVNNATPKSREKMHYAATLAGMAFGSAFLGIVHAMSHTVGALFHVPHGRTNSMFLPYVVRYNSEVPKKLNFWPKYEHYVVAERIQDIARYIGLDASTPEKAVDAYAKAILKLRKACGVEDSFQDMGVDRDAFISQLDKIALRSYEDQCAPANPRLPILEDMKDILFAAYYGISQADAKTRRPKEEAEVKARLEKAPKKK